MDERAFPHGIFPSRKAGLFADPLYGSLAMSFRGILFDVHRCVARSDVPGVFVPRAPVLLPQKRAEAGSCFFAEKNEVNLHEKKIVCREIPGISWNGPVGKLFAVADPGRPPVEFCKKPVVKPFSISEPVVLPVENDAWNESVFDISPIRFEA